MSRTAPGPRRTAQWAALGLLVVTLLVVVGAAALSVFTCSFATYNCPSNGCGTVPQQNCNSSTQLAWEVMETGAPIAAAALAAFLWLRRPSGAAPAAVPS